MCRYYEIMNVLSSANLISVSRQLHESSFSCSSRRLLHLSAEPRVSNERTYLLMLGVCERFSERL